MSNKRKRGDVIWVVIWESAHPAHTPWRIERAFTYEVDAQKYCEEMNQQFMEEIWETQKKGKYLEGWKFIRTRRIAENDPDANPVYKHYQSVEIFKKHMTCYFMNNSDLFVSRRVINEHMNYNYFLQQKMDDFVRIWKRACRTRELEQRESSPLYKHYNSDCEFLHDMKRYYLTHYYKIEKTKGHKTNSGSHGYHYKEVAIGCGHKRIRT
jgi:hypothetical protein